MGLTTESSVSSGRRNRRASPESGVSVERSIASSQVKALTGAVSTSIRPWRVHRSTGAASGRSVIHVLSAHQPCEAEQTKQAGLIREGFEQGIPGEQLAEAAGLSVPRVYEIRDARH